MVPDEHLSPLQKLSLAYASTTRRGWLTTVYGFDNRLGQIAFGTLEPVFAQMKFAWWREFMAKPASQWPAGDPMVQALAAFAEDSAIMQQLRDHVDCWDSIHDQLLNDNSGLVHTVTERGRGLIALSLGKDAVVGLDPAMLQGGMMWSLWDGALRCNDENCRRMLWEAGRALALQSRKLHLPRRFRSISMQFRISRFELLDNQIDRTVNRPGTAWRLLSHGLTGL
jgi:hypothetical protein